MANLSKLSMRAREVISNAFKTEEIKQGIKQVSIRNGYAGSAPIISIELESSKQIRIEYSYLKDYILEKIKKGEFKISKEEKGNSYARIEFTN